MTLIHAGALVDRAPGRKYVGALGFAEIAPAEPLPRAVTVRRWREELPGEFTVSFVVPPAACRSAKGALRFDDEMSAAFDWAKESAEALDARFVVVPTPRDLTTGQRDRDLLAAWIERFGTREGRDLVWHPQGLWDHELAVPFARKLGVALAVDPLEAEPTGERVLYARLRALGIRARFTETLLLDALDTVLSSGAEEAYVAIDSPRSFKEATRLAQLAADEG